MTTPPCGRLIGASLGPGDPGLITRRAWDTLCASAFWTYPVRKHGGESYALDIALRAGVPLPVQHTPLVFPMTHDRAVLQRYWHAGAATVIEQLQCGIDVVFLVEGDASTYSTFGHLARAVMQQAPHIEIETIPGVSSYHAAAARVNLSLADTDDTLAILPAGYGVAEVERMLHDFDTLVLLKVKPLLDDLLLMLERKGLAEHSYFVEKAGAPQERVVREVTSLRGTKVNYLSLLIVHNPHRVKLDMVRGCRKPATKERHELAD
ncbi:MAG: precorrin-2 C(20)-methyltransferase [Gammaproteobacteria bacterium]|nr:precorrin-2 C(20)-methyltransferase [Gammaproteobacteria bacterium]